MKELEIEIGDYDSISINSGGSQPVTIHKEYGPTVIDSVRIHLDTSTYEWVFEQEKCRYDEVDSVEWIEVGRSAG